MAGIVRVARTPEAWLIVPLLAVILVNIILMTGLFTVEPNQGVVMTLFGTSKARKRILGCAGLERRSIHGQRRTFGTIPCFGDGEGFRDGRIRVPSA